MKIVNLTPHSINIYRKEDAEHNPSLRKAFIKPGARPILTIPSSGMVNAHITYTYDTMIDKIPIYKPVVQGIDPLPPKAMKADIIIVSALYASAAKMVGVDTTKLVTVSQPVYDNPNNPRPVGCIGLNRVE